MRSKGLTDPSDEEEDVQRFYKADVHDYSEKTEEQKRTVFVDRTEAILAQENALWVVAQQSQDGDKTRSGESSIGS